MVTTAPARVATVTAASLDGVAASPPPPAAPALLPTPAQFAALGAVLCVFRMQTGGALGGWAQAVRAEVASGVDSDGLHGELRFFDRDGRCCWRLFLLPDGDFLAWEQLCAVLPARGDGRDAPVAERLWRRLAGRLLGGGWQATALQLHALPLAPGFAQASLLLAASLARLSGTGVAAARRMLAAEGVAADGIAAAVADCCCRSAHTTTAGGADAPHDYTSIRLKGSQA